MPLFFALEGAGRSTIVFLHAFPLSGAMWDGERKEFTAQGFRVLVADLPGFGQSIRQAKPFIPDMASSVLQLLDSVSIQEPVTVVGLSMGGYVAFEMLRQAPRRIRALGLCSTRATSDTEDEISKRMKTAEQIRREGLVPQIEVLLPRLLGRTTLAQKPKISDYVRSLILANEPGGIADSLEAMAYRRDSTDLLSGISCPTLIVVGAEDVLIPMTQSQDMQQGIPDAHTAVIHQAGHLVNLEQPRAFNEALRGFLRTHAL